MLHERPPEMRVCPGRHRFELVEAFLVLLREMTHDLRDSLSRFCQIFVVIFGVDMVLLIFWMTVGRWVNRRHKNVLFKKVGSEVLPIPIVIFFEKKHGIDDVATQE